MYPTCRTDGVWRSLVARPLWERKVVGSNPATPTNSTTGIALTSSRCGQIAACGYYASCVPVCLMYRAESAEPLNRSEDAEPQAVSHKETEP